LKLDIGCDENKKEGFVGVDIVQGKQVDFVMDVCDLKFEDDSIDEIFSRRCIQHVKDEQKALSEILRVLKPNSLFTLEVASWYGWLYYRLHLSASYGRYKTFHLYWDSKIKKTLENANFTVQSLRHIPSPRGRGYDIQVVCKKEAVHEASSAKTIPP
jgi:ubiquinone/menaquinone biosynthesis C-methylase UbiE